MNTSYYSAVLRFVENEEGLRTQWHPTDRVGPFATLTRGAFDTLEKAHEWCEKNGVHPSTYTVKEYSLLPNVEPVTA